MAEGEEIVVRKIGQKLLKMHSSHMLPTYQGLYTLYDRALPRISKKLKEIDGRLIFVDIGANIGDTIALVTDVVDGHFLAIEGDPQYLPLLKENTKEIKNSTIDIEEAYCAEEDTDLEGIEVDRHRGTAKLIKQEDAKKEGSRIKTKRLDTIINEHPAFKKTNLLKIDTDGFESEVLRGATQFLETASPLIFFEFTPQDYTAKNENPLGLFTLLRAWGYKEGLVYDNFGYPKAIIRLDDIKTIEELISKVDEKLIYYYDILTWKDSDKEKYEAIVQSELLAIIGTIRNEKEQIIDSRSELAQAQQELAEERKQLQSASQKAAELKQQLESNENELSRVKLELADIQVKQHSQSDELLHAKNSLANVTEELESIRNSKGWKAITFLRRFNATIFPVGSLRRKIFGKIYGLILRVLRLVYRGVRFVTNSARKGIRVLRSRIFKKRVVKTNKLVYIGHSYHAKSLSTKFLLEYLREFFDLEVILDYSWQGQAYPDLSFIDETYAGVIFFQNLPDPTLVNSIKNDNKIYFPMYDNGLGGRDQQYWKQYQHLKVIHFSRTLYEIFKKWGINSMYIQYFPEVTEIVKGDPKEVFFWQRVTRLNINTVTSLLRNQDVSIHVHRAVDPGQTYVPPSKQESKKFHMTFSDWTKYREEMWVTIRKKAIYIAPRVSEGIGLSFLEAMAMGKAVIAVDNPTMNEYIVHNKTGYLYDIENISEIDLSNLSEVQENTYRYMLEGYRSWLKKRENIIKFIKMRT